MMLWFACRVSTSTLHPFLPWTTGWRKCTAKPTQAKPTQASRRRQNRCWKSRRRQTDAGKTEAGKTDAGKTDAGKAGRAMSEPAAASGRQRRPLQRWLADKKACSARSGGAAAGPSAIELAEEPPVPKANQRASGARKS
jgi:hypothetical protein